MYFTNLNSHVLNYTALMNWLKSVKVEMQSKNQQIRPLSMSRKVSWPYIKSWLVYCNGHHSHQCHTHLIIVTSHLKISLTPAHSHNSLFSQSCGVQCIKSCRYRLRDSLHVLIRMEKKCDVGDFHCGVVVGRLVWLESPGIFTTVYRVYTEWYKNTHWVVVLQNTDNPAFGFVIVLCCATLSN